MGLKLVVSACQIESSAIYYNVIKSHGVFSWRNVLAYVMRICQCVQRQIAKNVSLKASNLW